VLLEKISFPDYLNPESIASLIRYPWAVREEVSIGPLANEWKDRADVPVLAVVTPEGILKGILSSVRLYSVLSRPYGWDVFQKKAVTDLLEPVQSFLGEDPLFLITERLVRGDGVPIQSYYAVVDSKNLFVGLFSQQDLVDYLSRSTQRDLALAQTLQNQLVRREWEIREEGIQAQGVCEMFKGVGGDFSTLRSPKPGHWFGCVCDVSGKGIAASLVTTLRWGVLEAVDLTLPLRPVV